jgi:hypothetical protein
VSEALYRPQRNWGARIHEYAVQGMTLVIMENEHLRIGILAGKGTDIVELNYKPRDLDMIWLAPAGVRNPVPHATTAPDSRGAFDEIYPGGWQEMFPNALGAGIVNGVPQRYHGEVHSLPWDVAIVEDTPETCAVRFTVRMATSPCVVEKTIRIETGKPGLRIDEVARNESPMPFTVAWGHHITFGAPYLGPGSQVTLPEGITAHALPGNGRNERRVGEAGSFPWPVAPATGVDMRILPDRGTIGEMLFLTGFAQDLAWYDVTPATGGPTCRVSWDGATMPVLWYWQEFGHSSDYPWYGRVYTVGLEPNSGMPTTGTGGPTDYGRALTLGPGESHTFWLELEVRDDASPG